MKCKVVKLSAKNTSAMRQSARAERAELSNGTVIFRLTWPGDAKPEASAQSWRQGTDIPREIKPKLRGPLQAGQTVEIADELL
jgi:hypothetical protein